MSDLPELGFGLTHNVFLHDQIMENRQHIDWLEVITDQYVRRPNAFAELTRLREHFPIAPHGVELSIGSDDPLDLRYVDEIAEVADAVDAPWVSDHLCYTRDGAIDLDSFTPVHRTREKARSIAAKARRIQEQTGRPFLLENIVYYVDVPAELTEAELVTEILERSDCGLLLDLNNVAVNANNHGFDAVEFLDAIPLERVVQVHLAGCSQRPELGGVILDSHDAPVGDEVFELLGHLAERNPPRGLVIERDQNIPASFDEFLVDLAKARAVVGARAPA